MFITTVLFVLGFIFLIKGAEVMVDGSSSIARRFGISTFFIGLTIVAFGTSAPELVVSALASAKGSSGIALGNIVGSNISNTLLILGVSALIAPLLAKNTTVNKEIPFRQAHTIVGELVNYAIEQGKDLHQLDLGEYQRFSTLFEEDIYSITIDSSIANRDIPGGTAPQQVEAQLDRAKKIIKGEDEG